MRLATLITSFSNLRGGPASLVRLLLLSGIFLSLIGSHLYVLAHGTDYKGLLLVLDHGFTLALVSTIFALCAGMGMWVLKRWHCEFSYPIELLSVATALGAGIFGTLILFCGLCAWLQPPVLLGLFILGALIGRRELQELPSLITQCVASLWHGCSPLALTVFCGMALFMIAQALPPSLDYDSLVYHLRVPAQFLQQGKIYLPEDNLHVAFVQLAHMLYLPLLMCGSASAPALMNVFWALLLGVTAFAFCLRFCHSTVASLILALVWGSTILVLTAVTAKVDIVLAYYLFVAHYLLILALTDSLRPVFFLSALLLGFGFGVKYHALVYALALSPLIVWTAFSLSRATRTATLSLLVYGSIFLGTMLPWLVKNCLLLGAPLYPFFTASRVEPWLTVFYPDIYSPLPFSSDSLIVLRTVRAQFNLRDFFFHPGRLTPEAEGIFYFAIRCCCRFHCGFSYLL